MSIFTRGDVIQYLDVKVLVSTSQAADSLAREDENVYRSRYDTEPEGLAVTMSGAT